MLVDLIESVAEDGKLVDATSSSTDSPKENPADVQYTAISGQLSTNREAQVISNDSAKIKSIFLNLSKAPVGSDIVVQILKNGEVASGNITIPENQNFIKIDGNTLSKKYLQASDVVSVRVLQTGSAYAGKDLQIQISSENVDAQEVTDKLQEEQTYGNHFRYGVTCNKVTKDGNEYTGFFEENTVFSGLSLVGGSLDQDPIGNSSSMNLVSVYFMKSGSDTNLYLQLRGTDLPNNLFDHLYISSPDLGRFDQASAIVYNDNGTTTWRWGISAAQSTSIFSRDSFVVWIDKQNFPTGEIRVYPSTAPLDGKSFCGFDSESNAGGIWGNVLSDGSKITSLYAHRKSGTGSIDVVDASNVTLKIENEDGRDIGAVFYPNNSGTHTVLATEAATSIVSPNGDKQQVEYEWDFTQETPFVDKKAPLSSSAPYVIPVVDTLKPVLDKQFEVGQLLQPTINNSTNVYKGYIKYFKNNPDGSDNIGSISDNRLKNGVLVNSLNIHHQPQNGNVRRMSMNLEGDQKTGFNFVELEGIGRFYLQYTSSSNLNNHGDTALLWDVSDEKFQSLNVGETRKFTISY